MEKIAQEKKRNYSHCMFFNDHGHQMDLKSGDAEQNFETYFVKLFSKIENK